MALTQSRDVVLIDAVFLNCTEENVYRLTDGKQAKVPAQPSMSFSILSKQVVFAVKPCSSKRKKKFQHNTRSSRKAGRTVVLK